ncbi:cell surface A33 antigen [Parus major]|uniref:cell surface A33 antigen n=1 Tax=Parus major TaxID=9157 RepID=UPI0007716077|nr:cell surface A33 antigen [Parus major]XP_033374586.1 cell surface A33 antigen [Parus major]XP_033374590.1 cell surface A33 antigen [Parus major]XP_033374592.1 cell surface A33 antigen [Parus major]
MSGPAMKGLGLFIFSAILVSAHALTVEAPAKEIQVARGRNATLRCNFKTNVVIDRGDMVFWRKIYTESDIISRYFDGFVRYAEGYDHRIQFIGDVDSGDISITLSAVTMEDNGTYVCAVRLRNDESPKSVRLDLQVLVAPSKPECKILGTPEYGQTINLTCVSHEGSPTPTYSWKSFDVQNQPRALPHTKGQQITLKNVSADTSGFYICTSTNTVGAEFCNMTVSIMPPSMNIALYAGIIGGVVAAIVVIGIIVYCCCCKKEKNTDYEMTVQEDRNEPSRQMPPPRNESIREDVENA